MRKKRRNPFWGKYSFGMNATIPHYPRGTEGEMGIFDAARITRCASRIRGGGDFGGALAERGGVMKNGNRCRVNRLAKDVQMERGLAR